MQQFVSQWWVVAAIIAASVVLWAVRSPSLKGRAGEVRLRRKLESILDDGTYHFLHDLTIPDHDGTAQIDHVLISPCGVFVIETKNYSGWIYGSADQQNWTHVFHRKKFRFQNPVHQNYNHVKAVQASTGMSNDQIHSLVVFVGSGEFKTQMPAEVVNIDGLKRYFWSKSEIVLSEQEIAMAIDRLENQRYRRGFLTNRRHRQHIREVVEQKAATRAPRPPARVSPHCPNCGIKMVLRTAKRGPNPGERFWGCQDFPRCGGTRRLERS
jgi:hypothetical protein